MKYILLAVFVSVPVCGMGTGDKLTSQEKVVQNVLSYFTKDKLAHATVYSPHERTDITALTHRVLKEHRNKGHLGLAAVTQAVKSFNENHHKTSSAQAEQIQQGITEELTELEQGYPIYPMIFLTSYQPQTAAVIGETVAGGLCLGLSCLYPPCTLASAISSLVCGIGGLMTLYRNWDEVDNGFIKLGEREQAIENLLKELYKNENKKER